MNLFSSMSIRILGAIFRIWLVALAAALIAVILCLGMIAAVFSVFWALLMGRKPAAFSVFRQFQRASHQFRHEGWTSRSAKSVASASEIVDVEVREVAAVSGDSRPPPAG